METLPKLWNRGGVRRFKTCNISETVQEGTNVTIARFQLVPKSFNDFG